MKILIVKLSSIGDIVHTLPALAAIRRALPTAEISWAVEKSSAEILRNNQFLHRLIEVDTRVLRRKNPIGETMSAARAQLQQLRASAYDVALDFQGLLKSASIARLARAERLYGFSKQNLREPASRFLLNDTFTAERQIHIIDKNLTLAEKALGIEGARGRFEFPIFTDDIHRLEAEKIVEQAGENFAILNPAGGWATKLWQAEKFGALADRLWEENNLTSIVTTAPNEAKLARAVLQNSKSNRVFLAQPSLKGFYELAKKNENLRRRRHRADASGDCGKRSRSRHFRRDRMVAQRQPESAGHLRRANRHQLPRRLPSPRLQQLDLYGHRSRDGFSGGAKKVEFSRKFIRDFGRYLIKLNTKEFYRRDAEKRR